MNDDELLYQFGLARREWRKDVRELKRQRNAHMEARRLLRKSLAEARCWEEEQ